MDWPVSRFPKLWHRWELPYFILPPNLSCTPFIQLQILQPAASLAGGICQNRSQHQDLTVAIAQTATIQQPQSKQTVLLYRSRLRQRIRVRSRATIRFSSIAMHELPSLNRA
ncbi:hypothetical protein QUB63_01430 [Microcoleus sp. ARI1-B5]|uniref:hypothetical protein n=1 Tax=unclassified Microcoleus TaxID=2642155 RepID=UPI002FD5DAAF